MRVILSLLAAIALPLEIQAQAGPRPEILVLGTYHMANPGRDVHNMEADDVLAPKRQQEITRLIEVLKRFRPTKIALEAAVGSQRVTREYADYLAGKYTLSRNENDQIGYRLARELGHVAVYAVDVDGDFPYMRVVNYAKANGREDKFNELVARTGARVKARGEFLRSHTVLETLDVMNADSSVARDVAEYFAFVPFADRFEYAGPDLLAMWYQRNIRIYHHILGLIQSPGDRVLVIYGAGHLGWLRQSIANDATVRLRTLADLLAAPPLPTAGQDTAAIRKELEEVYARNTSAFLSFDVKAVMALRAPDFHTVGPDGTTRDRAAMETYTVGILNGVKKWNRITLTIDSLRVSGDTAFAVVSQHLDRQALRSDNAVHHVLTWVTQREIWIRTRGQWLLWRVDQLRNQRRVVDGRPG